MLYQLDFEQVAAAGFSTRQRPTMAVSELDKAVTEKLSNSLFVRSCQRWHHGGWHLPLWDREVRYWLSKQRFTQPPQIIVGGIEVPCGKEVGMAMPMPDSAEVAMWVEHYSLPQFTRAYLLQEAEELGPEGSIQFSYGKEHERAPRLAAIKHLLAQPESEFSTPTNPETDG